jgi:hypothetical protein
MFEELKKLSVQAGFGGELTPDFIKWVTLTGIEDIATDGDSNSEEDALMAEWEQFAELAQAWSEATKEQSND